MIEVVRSREAPASLADGKRYDGEDVLRALHRDFLGKCYLCETPIGAGTLQIDHRRPKGEGHFPELAYAWTNLFPTCRTYGCNQRREHTYPDGGLLDPAGGDHVEERVLQRINGFPSGRLRSSEPVAEFVAVREDDLAAANTARELDRIHNGTGSYWKARITAKDLRGAIVGQVTLCSRLHQELEGMALADPAYAKTRDELNRLLSREAPYSMLVRSYFAAAR